MGAVEHMAQHCMFEFHEAGVIGKYTNELRERVGELEYSYTECAPYEGIEYETSLGDKVSWSKTEWGTEEDRIYTTFSVNGKRLKR